MLGRSLRASLTRPNLHQTDCQRCPVSSRLFSRTSVRRDDSFPNHYEALGLPPDASAADIKRSFYSLSKKYHPDLHPDDPTASRRFVIVSEAYHTLGSPEKRQRYDRDFSRANASAASSSSSSSNVPRGSYSSHAAGPAGSRPASGLSRRRTQFRGPPPSFYRSGQYGEQGAKRAQYAYSGQSEPGEETFSSAGPGGGFGPGQGEERFDPDIPHWDRAGHQKTHDNLWGRRSSASAEQKIRDWEAVAAQSSTVFNFVVVAGIIVAVTSLSSWLWDRRQPPAGLKREREGA